MLDMLKDNSLQKLPIKEYLKIICLITFSNISNLFIILIVHFDFNWDLSLKYITKFTGLSTMDTYSAIFTGLVSFVMAMFIISGIVRKGKDIRQGWVSLHEGGLPIVDEIKIVSKLKRDFRPLLISFVIALPNAILYQYFFMRDLYNGYGKSLNVLAWSYVLAGPTIIFGMFNPLLTGAAVLCHYMMSMLSELFNQVAISLEVSDEEDDHLVKQDKLFQVIFNPEEGETDFIKPKLSKQVEEEDEDKLKKATEQLQRLCEIQLEVNNALNPLLLTLFSMVLILSTLMCYGFYGILFAKISILRVVMTLQHLFNNIMHFNIVWGLCHTGENLRSSIGNARKSMENYVMENNEIFEDESTVKDVLELQRRLDVNNVFSAYNFFQINHSTVLGLSATVLTYLIVLLQFKVAEKQHDEELFAFESGSISNQTES